MMESTDIVLFEDEFNKISAQIFVDGAIILTEVTMSDTDHICLDRDETRRLFEAWKGITECSTT